LTGNFIAGIWYALIGIFLRNAARMSYQQVLMKQYLEGEPISRFMNQEIITVAPSLSVEDLVEDYIYKHHFKMFPVLEGSELVGCVSSKALSWLDASPQPR
jgi:predicted transcriptional regulator